MNRSLIALAAWALAACQSATPSSPAPTLEWTTAPAPQPTVASSPSPAAKLIVFTRGTDHGAQLEAVDETGGLPRPINSPDLEVPRWSPDGDWIAVAREESDHSVHVSLVRADGSGYRELHHEDFAPNWVRGDHPQPEPTLNLGVAVWTPDGEWLACEAWDSSNESRDGIYIVKVADGSGLAKIAPRGIPGSFSADGKRLVFSLAEGKEHRLAIVNIDGTGFASFFSHNLGAYPGFMSDGTLYDTIGGNMGFFDLHGTLMRTFTAPGGTMSEARLSPDGKRFVFLYFKPASSAAIATINIDGTDLQVVVPAVHGELGSPDWQP